MWSLCIMMSRNTGQLSLCSSQMPVMYFSASKHNFYCQFSFSACVWSVFFVSSYRTILSIFHYPYMTCRLGWAVLLFSSMTAPMLALLSSHSSNLHYRGSKSWRWDLHELQRFSLGSLLPLLGFQDPGFSEIPAMLSDPASYRLTGKQVWALYKTPGWENKCLENWVKKQIDLEIVLPPPSNLPGAVCHSYYSQNHF